MERVFLIWIYYRLTIVLRSTKNTLYLYGSSDQFVTKNAIRGDLLHKTLLRTSRIQSSGPLIRRKQGKEAMAPIWIMDA